MANTRKSGKGAIIALIVALLVVIAAIVFVVIGGEKKIADDKLAEYNSHSEILADQSMADMLHEVFDKTQRTLSQEDFDKIETVQVIDYADTNMIYFDLVGETEDNSDVKTFDLNEHHVDDFSDIALFTNLKNFGAIYTGFENFDFLKNAKNLEEFSVMENYDCHDYSFLAGLESVKTVSLSGCVIDDISFVKDLKNVETLGLSSITVGDNALSDISFMEGLDNVKTLDLSSNGISDLTPLAGLTNLDSLELSYNAIDNVEALAGLTNLTYLNLTQATIKDVSPLTHFDADKFERLILDLNESVEDWSLLDYLGDKVQGKPIPEEESEENVESEEAEIEDDAVAAEPADDEIAEEVSEETEASEEE